MLYEIFYNSGKVSAGDQILMVEGCNLQNLTQQLACSVIHTAFTADKVSNEILWRRV